MNHKVTPDLVRLAFEIHGLVQGVGFRPYVYRLAQTHGLTGWIRNNCAGVQLELQGTQQALDAFSSQLTTKLPGIAQIEAMASHKIPQQTEESLTIVASQETGPGSALILPDLATCQDCLDDISQPENRRYRYPFTNCTYCGPRYTILERLPYDRTNTTMKSFAMCDDCQHEYQNPLDRRFHAQPNACHQCGPQLQLVDPQGILCATKEDALRTALSAIKNGQIVAVMGLGGFQCLVDATNSHAIQRLRTRKQRPTKPLALMLASLQEIHRYCQVSPAEETLLRSPQAPIVLLQRHTRAALPMQDHDDVTSSPVDRAPSHPRHTQETHPSMQSAPTQPVLSHLVAPGNHCLGMMLPTTPLHHLLLQDLGRPLVATSGNPKGQPICTQIPEALEKLTDIADLFLIHDRPILWPVDDSVARIIDGAPQLLRRARGYAPLPLQHPMLQGKHIAAGAHQKAAVALQHQQYVWISPYLGDLDSAENQTLWHRHLEAMQATRGHHPETDTPVESAYIICDMHPDYASTQMAEALATSTGTPLLRIQHHKAHAFATLMERQIKEPALAIVWDGTGWGEDGSIWGGEWFSIKEGVATRIMRLRPFPLPGASQAILEPRRSALGLLFAWGHDAGHDKGCHDAFANLQDAFTPTEYRLLQRLLTQDVQAPLCSSMGRLFDAIAGLLGLTHRCSFEGEAAMALESLQAPITKATTPYTFMLSSKPNEPCISADWSMLLTQLADDLDAKVAPGLIARRFHLACIALIVESASMTGINNVIMTGGCFQNKYLLEGGIQGLRDAGFCPIWPQQLPPNDEGIAAGQIWAAQQARRDPRETHKSVLQGE